MMVKKIFTVHDVSTLEWEYQKAAYATLLYVVDAYSINPSNTNLSETVRLLI